MEPQQSEKNNIEQLSQDDLFQNIGDICTVVTSAVDTKELLEVSLKKTMDLFGANRGSIFLLNEDGKELVLKIAQGMEMVEQEKMVKRMGEGVVGRVAQIKQPLFVEDISKDSRFHGHKPQGCYHTPSFICAPLMVKDKLIGVINIADKESKKRFSKHELQLLDFLSTQIALNYKRIQLYQKFKSIVKESRTLKDELGKTSQETSYLKKQIVLQEKLASLGKLAGGIAHEFNNPLDGVKRYTNLSLEHLKDNDVVYGYLLEIKNGLNRMANIVKSLLACARNTTPTLQKIDINHAIEQIVSGLQLEIFQKSVTLIKKMDNDLPLITDLGIERVVNNLLQNAIDAVNYGGEIEISSLKENDRIVIKVRDSGCGIAQEDIEKIFEPFFTTKDMEKGCGLGLTIVNEIVKYYNGKIEVESLLQRGTTFTVFLPIAEINGSIQ